MVNTNMLANRGISSLHTIHRNNQSFILPLNIFYTESSPRQRRWCQEKDPGLRRIKREISIESKKQYGNIRVFEQGPEAGKAGSWGYVINIAAALSNNGEEV